MTFKEQRYMGMHGAVLCSEVKCVWTPGVFLRSTLCVEGGSLNGLQPAKQGRQGRQAGQQAPGICLSLAFLV